MCSKLETSTSTCLYLIFGKLPCNTSTGHPIFLSILFVNGTYNFESYTLAFSPVFLYWEKGSKVNHFTNFFKLE